MSVFNGRAIDIEDNRNKVSIIDKNSTNKQYPSAKAVFDALQTVETRSDIFANALKGSASGQGYVVVKDVSPLEHEIKVQLSNSSGGGEESVSQTATLNGTMRELLLDEPSSKVHVKFEQVDTYCDGAIVPLVDGEDLKAVSEVIFTPAYWYGEQLTLLDITYTITDSTLEWKGTYTSLTNTEAEPEDISGNYTLSSSGQKIIGFYQIYDSPEDNPDHSDGGEYMENSLDIIVSVLANSFSGVAVTVGGKNLFNLETLVQKVLNKEGSWNKSSYYVVSIPFKPNTKYYLKCNGTRTTEGGVTIVSVKYEVNTSIQDAVGIANTTWGAERAVTTDETGNIYFGFAGTGAVVPSENIVRTQFEAAMLQIEEGATATEYEPYIEPVIYTANADGSVDGVKSIYPSTSVSVEDASTVVNIEYNRDINKAFAELQAAVISLGGNV